MNDLDLRASDAVPFSVGALEGLQMHYNGRLNGILIANVRE